MARNIRPAAYPISLLSVSLLGFSLATTPLREYQFGASPQVGTGASIDVGSAGPRQILHAALWRTDLGFASTIMVKNESIVGPVAVFPVLYMADGAVYPLPLMRLLAGGSTEISINEALTKMPTALRDHLSDYGSAVLLYSAPGAVVAEMHLLNAPESLVYVYSFAPNASTGTGQHTLEGLWWKHDAGVGGFVSLANTTEHSEDLTFQATGSEGTALAPQQVTLGPHATELLDLDSTINGLPEAERGSGGLRIQFSGDASDVVVAGGLVNEVEGYSAGIPFVLHDAAQGQPTQTTLASTGLVIGRPTMGTGFPEGTQFTPYAVLRNTTSNPVEVKPVLYYMTDGGPAALMLAPVRLKPSRSLELRVQEILARLTEQTGTLTLQLSYKGTLGDLVVATGSVDQSGTYVFEVLPQGVGQSLAKLAPFWSVADGYDTMISLWNPEDAPQDVVVTFTYSMARGAGRYSLPVRLAAKAGSTIDVAHLIAERKPDPDGNIIPPEVQQGSAVVANPQGVTEPLNLVVSEGAFNVANATCLPCCTVCFGVTTFSVSPSSFNCPIAKTYQLKAFASYTNGTTKDVTNSSKWTSKNTAVATVQSSGSTNPGLVTGVQPGSDDIECQFTHIQNNPCIISGGCLSKGFNFCCIGNVQPTVSISGPAYVPLRAAGSTGPNSMTLSTTVNPSGGSYSWTTTSNNVTLSNTSSASVTVTAAAASTTIGDVPITVTYTVNNQSAQATANITVEQPTSLQVVSDTTTANGHTCDPSATTNTCQTSGFQGTSTYTSYLRNRTYHIMDQFNPSRWIQGYALDIRESFGASTGQCAGPSPTSPPSSGDTILDCFYFCSATCQSGGSCNVSATQTITVNGFSVATESVNWTCSGVSLTP